jgi:hypothetical protein
MATLEERIQAIEQEQTTLKKTIELQTIAIGALVNKATLEKLNEKYDKLFDVLMNHDRFTNEQLAEIRNQQAELDGKIVGQQTEMRQRLTQIEKTQQEHTATFAEQKTLLTTILARLPEKP